MIELEKVGRSYRGHDRDEVAALHDVDLKVAAGEMVAITGPSGSGTATLLNILGCLDLPTKGSYRLDGVEVGRLSSRRLAKLRGRTIGFVFGSFELSGDATVQRNVELPLIYTRARVRRRRAAAALDRVGLHERRADMPVELFPAQQRRALIARALVNDPPVLLDDEPTRNLDPDAALEVMTLLTRLNGEGRTVIYRTHDEQVARYATRVVRLDEGGIASDTPNEHRNQPPQRPPDLRVV
jgi:putative ABC transport system ATP-binding protein